MGIPSPAQLIDKGLDLTVVGGFSRIGYVVRRRGWRDLEPGALEGRLVVITGPTSGLGFAAAVAMRRLGASLVLVGRDGGRLARTSASLRADRANGGDLVEVVADMGDLDAVEAATSSIRALGAPVHALVHNAGALDGTRGVSPQGIEQTIATHVVGPHLMTSTLLSATEVARVITVSSGGMYASSLPDLSSGGSLEMPADRYDGTKQYSIAKRAQVTLNELWAERVPGTWFGAMHPGWADTPGVRSSIPGFAKVTGPILRTAEQGADTIVWLVATDEALPTGRFWSDRAERPVHRVPGTRGADTPAARAALWDWCDQAIAPYTG